MNRKEWLIAAILTFITICAWVAFDIVHTRSRAEISSDWQEAIEPIDPQFNLEALESTP